MPTVRTPEEIQAAHDRLVAIILGEVPNPFDQMAAFTNQDALGKETVLEYGAFLQVWASVLCWVLHHDHNQTFAQHLLLIDKALAVQGFELRDNSGQRMPGDPPADELSVAFTHYREHGTYRAYVDLLDHLDRDFRTRNQTT